METTMTAAQTFAHVKEESTTSSKLIQELEDSRLISFPSLLLPILCLSGIAAGFGAHGDIFKLAIILIPNIFSISFTLGLAPARWILGAFMITVFCDILILSI